MNETKERGMKWKSDAKPQTSKQRDEKQKNPTNYWQEEGKKDEIQAKNQP